MLCNRDQKGNVSYTYEANELSAQDILDYWTPERKASAKPAGDWTHDRPCALDSVTAATDPQRADTSQMPFQAGGKLFFVRGGEHYVASASVACSNSLVLTAAHCVQDNDTGTLCDKFLFERCYDDGDSAEELTFRTVALKEYWYESKQWKWDYAFAVLNGSSTLATPLTYSTEDIAGKPLVAYGYPTNYYDGKQMVYINGDAGNTSFGTWEISGDKMRGGSSGGAWVLKDTTTAVGLNSYGPVDPAYAYMGSPVFDADFDSLYEYVKTLI